ncbi:hypothetical protein [Adhaeribacter soli]|uniref:WG repeat-containing protein n=1 Tax=Adhaeribacter soli TaxID=2607655 RepID=A0A5N1J038_9BACT|nr:hypothetical protein [Adhaeribacter soli]KAA9333712.1 hypothetical protein F0P94_10715 [Adhaeribacter soli]
MSLFLNSILPRIKQFSASLDQKELFVDKPWAVIDEELNQQKYIFRRSGELIMSLNGQVSMGAWEYLPEAKCILLDRVSDKILLNHNFLNPAVMILKKDGYKNANLILANEVLIPDLDVATYLQNLLDNKNCEDKLTIDKAEEEYRNKNNNVIETVNGEKLQVAFSKSWKLKGTKVFQKGTLIDDGIYELYKGKFYEIVNGEIINTYFRQSFKTKLGLIQVEKEVDQLGFSVGNLVFLNGLPAPNGKYNLGFLSKILVENGRIKNSTFF